MYHDPQPEPPLSEPDYDMETEVITCPCCNQRWNLLHFGFSKCESCNRNVCRDCAGERNGHVLCKDCKDQPACPECGSYIHVVRTVDWWDEEFQSSEQDTVLECVNCGHMFDGESE